MMIEARKQNALPLFILLLIFFLTAIHQTDCFIKTKNVYSFGQISNSGFTSNIASSTTTPVQNTLLANFLFNGTESWKLATGGIERFDVSVTLQQLVPGYSAMFYIVEYFNTTTTSSLGQMIFVSGDNQNGQASVIKPPYIISTPEPIFIYSTNGKPFNPFSNSNRIIHMSCMYSCLIVSSNGNVYYHNGLQEAASAGKWNVKFSASSYNDPDTGILLSGVKYVHAAVGGFYGCETLFAVTNYGHVKSMGCHNVGLRGTTFSNSELISYVIPSLRNISTVSVGFLNGNGNGRLGMTAAGAIDVFGVLWTWGSNLNGMLGWNSTQNVSEIAQPVTLLPTSVSKISFGFGHAIALLTDNTVYCFGDNTQKQCDSTSSDTAIYAPRRIYLVDGSLDCAATIYMSACKESDGDLRSWGASTSILGHGQATFGMITMASVSTVSNFTFTTQHGMAITSDGKVSVWGSNSDGLLTLGDEFMVRYPRKLGISALSYQNVSVLTTKGGDSCSFVLSTLGNDTSTNILDYWGLCGNVGFGISATNPITAPPALTSKKVIDIDMRTNFAVALVDNGDVYGWGNSGSYYFGTSGSTSTPTLIYSNVSKISTGSANTYLLLKDGITLLGVGDNSQTQIGVGSHPITTFTAMNTSFLQSNEKIVDIKGGSTTFYVLTSMGNVYGIGLNDASNRYLSSSSQTSYSNFIRINGNVKVRKIVIGFYHYTIFISTSGVAYYFYGNPVALNLPASDSYVVDGAAFSARYYFITKKGSVYTAGVNAYYETSYNNGFAPSLVSPSLYASKEYFEGIPHMALAGLNRAAIVTRDEYTCFGVNSTDASVCSSHGYCSNLDQCTCDEGYSGLMCDEYSCNGISALNSSVCSGRGVCSAPETCSNCTNSIGTYCQYVQCYGVYANSGSVCSGNGNCTSIDKCECKIGFYGNKCQYRSCFGTLNGALSRQTTADVFCANINKLLK